MISYFITILGDGDAARAIARPNWEEETLTELVLIVLP